MRNSIKMIKSVFCILTVVMFICFNTLSYGADYENTETENKQDTTRSFSLTVSPFHLYFPIYELTGEFNIGNDCGLALIGGYGNVWGNKLSSDTSLRNEIFKIYEAGAQADYYLAGSFDHGLQLGVEALYVGMLGNHENIEMSGNGLAAGPFLGYKVIYNFGLTINIQAGYQRLLVHAKTGDGSGSAGGSDNIFLLNINAGWSF